jgi:hypothetical protein
MPPIRLPSAGALAARLAALAAAALLAACATPPAAPPEAARPEAVRAAIASAIPATVPDRAGWAVDVYAALVALGLPTSDANVCSVLAVVEQESGFRADPAVPRLGRIVREELDRRAASAGVPQLLVQAALAVRSPDTRTNRERIDAARTEKELSDLFDDFVGEVPLGGRLLAGYNPVRTAGPMQVSIAFAEQQARAKPYPYRMAARVRDEVFTRRGGLYFGIAHLLDYPARYESHLFRYADFNAGHHASRNAAFQAAVAQATGIPLDRDGDLLAPGAPLDRPGATEAAVRTLLPRLERGATEASVRRALEAADGPGFEDTRLWTRVFELADASAGRPLPRAVVPSIRLASPKITRPLTTEWFARRVEERQKRCLATLSRPPARAPA